MNKDEEIKETIQEEDSNLPEDTNLDTSESEASTETPITDEEELKARQNGWDPNKGTKTAREFNLTGELIDLKKAVQKRDKDIEEILKYHDTVVNSQKENYKRQLETAIKQAKDSGDIDNFEQLHNQKVQFDQQEVKRQQEQLQNQVKNAIDSFAERNRHWYNPEHQDLVQDAIRIESDILSGRYEMETGIPKPQTYEAVLKQIEYEMSRRAPDLIRPNQQSRPAISQTRSGINKSSETISQQPEESYHKLSSSEQAAFRSLKRMFDKQGIKYSVKEFVQKTQKDGEI